MSTEELTRLKNQLATLNKKADFYKREYDKTYKKLQAELNKVPHNNALCISNQNIHTKIDEIILVNYKDTFGIEKTIQSNNQDGPLNLVLFKNQSPKVFNSKDLKWKLKI